MLLSKLFSKYSNDTKVKADKFINKIDHIKPEKSIASQKTEQSSYSKPLNNNPINENRNTSNSNAESDFSNLFSGKRTLALEEDIKSEIMSYCREVVEPVIKQIKEELSKHQREVRVNLNTILLIGSASVYYKGRAEYDYIIQIKQGKTKSSSTIVIKGSGERGGLDMRKSLSGLTIEEVKRDEYLKDFLNGYKSFMTARGWM